MNVFGIKITPVSRIWGIDVRPLFAWLEKLEQRRYKKQRARRLDIHDVVSKGD